MVLTLDMQKMINCGMNFCSLPIKKDIPQMLVDWKRFERSMMEKNFAMAKKLWIKREKIANKNK